MNSEIENCDVLVIGAGPSGSLAAAMLHNKGWSVKVLEKQQFPRFVIGESLLPRCMDSLKEADMLKYVSDLGFQQKKGARFERNGQICDFDFADQFTHGSTWTWQVPREEFDLALANGLIEKGVELEYQATVENMEFNKDFQICIYTNSKGETKKLRSKFVVDGSGYGRVIPKLLKLDKPSDFPVRTAVFSHVEFPKNHPTAHLIDIVTVTEKMWAWVIVFGDGRASVGFVGDDSCFEGMGSTAEEKWRNAIALNPYIRDKVGEVKFKRQPSEIRGYSIGVSKFYGDGFLLTGNSTEFLDPIFSSGVTFAMETGVLGAKLIDRQLKGEPVNWETEYSDYIKRGVNVFRSYVKGWYAGELPTIFYTEKTLEKFKSQICSVLAGYVWDEKNPFVTKHDKLIGTLSKVVGIMDDAESEKPL